LIEWVDGGLVSLIFGRTGNKIFAGLNLGALLLLLFFLCFSILTDDWVLKFMRDEAMLLSFVVEQLKFLISHLMVGCSRLIISGVLADREELLKPKEYFHCMIY
jgi:hypothetical protein